MKKLLSSIFALFILSAGATSFGASVTVNTTVDEFGGSGDCSLRDAIQSANTDSEFGGCTRSDVSVIDTVILPSSPNNPYVVDLGTAAQPNDDNMDGDLDLCNSMTIQGGGATDTVIQANFPGNEPDRVMHILSGCSGGGGQGTTNVVVNIDGVSIEGGTVSYVSAQVLGGGGIYVGQATTLNLSNSVVQNNGGDNTGRNQIVVTGGGIYNRDNLNITASDIRDNNISVTDPNNHMALGAGIANGRFSPPVSTAGDLDGQGDNCGPINLIQTTNINGNIVIDGGGGGGIFNFECSLTLLMSAVWDNHVLGSENGPNFGLGPITGSGGGIANKIAGNSNAVLEVIDTTLSGNSAVLHGGGHYDFVQEGAVKYSSSTVASNAADADGNNNGDGGGWYRAEFSVGGTPAPFTFQNTIVADNLAVNGPDCFSFPQAALPPPPYTSVDYNLVRDTSACVIDGTTTNNKPAGSDPNLGTLMNNGGRTPTHALLPGSEAIDMGNDVDGCTDGIDNTMNPPLVSGMVLPFDQRADGFPRTLPGVVGGTPRCDIGAFEFSPTEISTEKQVSAPVVQLGENFTYTIVITNNGPGTATNVQINDPLPAQVSFVSFGNISQGTCNQAGNVVSCDLGALAAGETATVEVNVQAAATGTATNTATVTTNETEPQNPSVSNEIVESFCVTGSGHFWDTIRPACANCSLNPQAFSLGFWRDYGPYLILGFVVAAFLAFRRRKIKG